MLANVDVLGVRCRPRGSWAGASSPSSPAMRRRGRSGRRRRDRCRRALALPAFTDQGGPFAGRAGRILGPAPTTPAARAALATLYSALMTADMLERLEAPGDLIVEGGFNRSPAFTGLLAALIPGRDVLVAPASGAAEGAALLAHWDEPHVRPKLTRAQSWSVAGLLQYRERWERGL